MFRQMLKLRRARKAFDHGRFREAYELAADPDIAEHLKAIRLRQACLDALGEAAAGHARKGELTLALDDVAFLRARGGEEVAAPRRSDLEARRAERDGLAERERARFYRARLEVERGDLIAARSILDGLEGDELGGEVATLRAELDRRIRDARGRIEEGLTLVDREPKGAEEALAAAAVLHPRAEGLREAWCRLAARRVAMVMKNKVGDPALAAFLTDWSIFKRAHLDGGDGAEGALDRQLREQVLQRARARLDRDDDAREAGRLLERLAETAGLGQEGEGLAAGVRDLAEAAGRGRDGDYDGAQKALERAAERLGKNRCLKIQTAELERARKNWGPYMARAEAAQAAGDLAGARRELLALLELAPELGEARRRLDRLAGRERDRLALLLALHGDLERGDLVGARRRVAGAGIDPAEDREVADLLREVELESIGRDQPRPQPTPSTQEAGITAPDRVGVGLVRISVEEHGELLVVEQDEVRLGAASANASELRFLAPLGAIQARIRRRTGFHAGVAYSVLPENGREVEVGGERIREARKLEDGDEIRLGRDLRLRFELPVERSRAAVLVVLSDHDCEGCRRIALMPPRGRNGALLFGPYARAHVSTPGLEGELEVHRESVEQGGELVAQGPLGVSLDGDDPRARVVLHDLANLRVRDLSLHVRFLPDPT